MKDEYDFSNAEQGRFYRPLKELNIPVYIDYDIQEKLSRTAKKDNRNISELVNSLLRNDIAIAESLSIM